MEETPPSAPCERVVDWLGAADSNCDSTLWRGRDAVADEIASPRLDGGAAEGPDEGLSRVWVGASAALFRIPGWAGASSGLGRGCVKSEAKARADWRLEETGLGAAGEASGSAC